MRTPTSPSSRVGVRREADRAADVGALDAGEQRLELGRGTAGRRRGRRGSRGSGPRRRRRRAARAAYGRSAKLRPTATTRSRSVRPSARGARASIETSGDDAGAADDADRGVSPVPGEPAADRPAQLEHVADLGHVVQEPRHLAARQALDQELDQRVAGVGGDRVRALRRVVVRRAQPDHVVLARPVPVAASSTSSRSRTSAVVGPLDLDDPRRGPAGRPWRDSSMVLTGRPGSAARATGRRGRGSRSAPRTPAGRAAISSSRVTHLADFQKYRCGTSSRTGPPCSPGSGSPVVLPDHPGLAAGDVGRAAGWWCSRWSSAPSRTRASARGPGGLEQGVDADAGERRVELRPGRHAVDVAEVRRPRQRVDLVARSRSWAARRGRRRSSSTSRGRGRGVASAVSAGQPPPVSYWPGRQPVRPSAARSPGEPPRRPEPAHRRLVGRAPVMAPSLRRVDVWTNGGRS